MSENKIYSSIAELVGNTPLVELGNYESSMTCMPECWQSWNILIHPGL